MKMKIKKLRPDAIIPRYLHFNDAGIDLCSIEQKILGPGQRALFKTGIAIELPKDYVENYEGQIRPRSGLALDHGVTVLNAPGTIDSCYRGEIGVILINHGKTPFQVTKGMRIAQLVIATVIRVEIEAVSSLDDTSRGTDGFGSTGID